ncbi:mitochondrial ribosomal protein L39 [Oratosquilla oratoria]|uniref:mitochondrial ribosomal protein L39 n=1 Tax=Oratosquilla oratoria TaxID=337810 RepID=UPI003F76877D
MSKKMLTSSERLFRFLPQIIKRYSSRQYSLLENNANVQKKRVQLFEKERARQAALHPDIEKIEVKYEGHPNDCTLIMNKNISTPYSCARHIDQMIMDRSALAEVNGQVWDMHRPLVEDCTLRLLHFRQVDPYYVNKAFWRSASLMLGAVLEMAFKDQFYVELCSFPSPNVRSGSFVYDVDLKMDKWKPTVAELRLLSAEMVKLSMASHDFERLEIDASLALKMFEDNRYKKAQVPHIAAQSQSGNAVVVYRVGNFVDMSRGPMISNTNHMGRCTVTAVHPIQTDQNQLFRVQGIALPRCIMLNSFSYSVIEDRARQINSGRIPCIAAFERQLSGPITDYNMLE